MFTYFFTTLQGQQWILPCGMGWREGELKTWTNIFVIFVRLGWVKLGSWGELEIGRNNRNLIEISRATEPGCLRQNRKQTRETKAYLSSKRKESEKKNKRKLKKWIRRRKKKKTKRKTEKKNKQRERTLYCTRGSRIAHRARLALKLLAAGQCRCLSVQW